VGLFRYAFPTSWQKREAKKEDEEKKYRSLNVFLFFSSAGPSAK
jgi:hypothetical protein